MTNYGDRIPLVYLPKVKGDCWEIAEDMDIVLSNGVHIIIPAGMTFDGRSTPWLLKWALPPINPCLLAYIIHDYLYKYDYMRVGLGDKKAKEFADNEMLIWEKKLGERAAESETCYWAVKLFGWKVFRKWKS